MFNWFSQFTNAGIINYPNQVLPKVNSSGVVYLHGTTVTGETKVSGKLSANEAKLNETNVSGSADFKNCKVDGDISVSGSVSISKSNVNKIKAVSNQVNIESSSTKDIVITGNTGGFSLNRNGQELILDGAQVNGSVTFTSGNGRVIRKNGSVITGQVYGGTVDDSLNTANEQRNHRL